MLRWSFERETHVQNSLEGRGARIDRHASFAGSPGGSLLRRRSCPPQRRRSAGAHCRVTADAAGPAQVAPRRRRPCEQSLPGRPRHHDRRRPRARHRLARACRLGRGRPRLHASRASRRDPRLARRPHLPGHQPPRCGALVPCGRSALRLARAPARLRPAPARGRRHKRPGRGPRLPLPPRPGRRRGCRLHATDRSRRLPPRRRRRLGASRHTCRRAHRSA